MDSELIDENRQNEGECLNVMWSDDVFYLKLLVSNHDKIVDEVVDRL